MILTENAMHPAAHASASAAPAGNDADETRRTGQPQPESEKLPAAEPACAEQHAASHAVHGGALLPTGGARLHSGKRSLPSARYWARGLFWGLVTLALAFALRMLEWPCWQNPEYRLGN